MENIEANLKRANLLAEKIGYEKIWNIEVTEFGVHIRAYKCMGVYKILDNPRFKVHSMDTDSVIVKRGKHLTITITTNK